MGEASIEAKRLAMKDGEKMFNREKEDFRKDMEHTKQMIEDQMKAMMKEKEAEERKMKEALDDLGVMEFGTTSLAQDIVNMHRRIDLQKDQMKMTQKFVEKLEKEKKDIEVMYDKLRRDHDAVRGENATKEMENLELQLQLNPEARAQYQAEAAMREDSRPKPKKKKQQKEQRSKDSEFDIDSEYEESSRGGGSRAEGSDADRPASRRKGGAASKMSAYDDEESSPQPVRKGGKGGGGDKHREKEMSVLNARARRERDY